MPEKQTIERAKRDKREGKAASTQAGEFVREEIHHIRAGKHGAASTKQAIAIGLAKARRAGVKLPAPPGRRRASKTRERYAPASKKGLSLQAKWTAKRRGPKARSAQARKAARTRKRVQQRRTANG